MLLNLHKSQQIRNVRHVHFSLHFTFVSTIISVCMCKGREEISLYRLICRPLHSMFTFSKENGTNLEVMEIC